MQGDAKMLVLSGVLEGCVLDFTLYLYKIPKLFDCVVFYLQT